MKLKWTLTLTALLHSPALAGDKFTVTLTGNSHSSSGSGSRAKEIEVRFLNGFGNPPVSTADKIKTLERQLTFYALMGGKKIDLEKEIDAVYQEVPLRRILGELIPGVAFEFKGVDDGETVKSLTIRKAPLEQVLQHLDDAAGVYFSYSKDGILITQEPQ